MKTNALALIALASAMLTFFPASAQRTSGTPGSPGATTTIDGKYLSPPPPKFGGEINLQASRIGLLVWCRLRARPTFCSS